MDENNSICVGKTSCTSFVIIVCLLCMAMLFNYIVRCIHSSQPSTPPSRIPLFTTAYTSSSTPNTDHNNPVFRRAMKSIPETDYEPGISSSCENCSFESENCTVCLAEFEEGEKVRVLPKCKHVYHKECIDKWLNRSVFCPVCREKVVDPFRDTNFTPSYLVF